MNWVNLLLFFIVVDNLDSMLPDVCPVDLFLTGHAQANHFINHIELNKCGN